MRAKTGASSEGHFQTLRVDLQQDRRRSGRVQPQGERRTSDYRVADFQAVFESEVVLVKAEHCVGCLDNCENSPVFG
jgi:hypothetical protein